MQRRNKEVVMFKDNANPVGQAHRIEEIERKVQFYCRLWDSQRNVRSLWVPKVSLSRVTNFLMVALDDLVVAIAVAALSGPDKKATVLAAIDRLYDYTVKEAMPFWMRPIAAPIKQYIVYILVSSAIDWMVAKYQSGSWKPTETTLDRVLMLADKNMVLCKSACRIRRGK